MNYILLQSTVADSAPPWLWILFVCIVTVVMTIDLGFCQRKSHKMETKEALIWVAVWVSLALLFNLCLWRWLGGGSAMEFFAGYLVELNLSVDNLFVFLMIFTYFSVPVEYQRRVLTWGILGAVIMRLLFIFVGMALVERFHWFFYVFGAILLYTGVKLLRSDPEVNPEKNFVLRLAKRFLPITEELHGERFFVRQEATASEDDNRLNEAPASAPAMAAKPKRARLMATPLFLVLLVVEATDVVFAVDSVPAILSLTDNLFIAFSSNVFAILGLRAMYFVLTSFLDKFHYLSYGLSLVLIFLGGKMIIKDWLHIDALPSLVVVVALLSGAIILSLLIPPKKRPLDPKKTVDG